MRSDDLVKAVAATIRVAREEFVEQAFEAKEIGLDEYNILLDKVKKNPLIIKTIFDDTSDFKITGAEYKAIMKKFEDCE